MLKVKNLIFYYTKDYNTLQNINFELKDKEIMFIHGEYESGRSCLLRILLGIESDFSGEVLYNNIPVSRDLFKTDIALGFVPEKVVCLENKSIYKNLEYVLKIRKVNKSIQDIKINNALKCYGLDVLKDEKMKNIGAFDRVKVVLARLSLRKLDYIFVDDIFKDLSTTELKYVITELKKLIRVNDASAIIVSDNMEIANMFKCTKYKLELGLLEKLEDKDV